MVPRLPPWFRADLSRGSVLFCAVSLALPVSTGVSSGPTVDPSLRVPGLVLVGARLSLRGRSRLVLYRVPDSRLPSGSRLVPSRGALVPPGGSTVLSDSCPSCLLLRPVPVRCCRSPWLRGECARDLSALMLLLLACAPLAGASVSRPNPFTHTHNPWLGLSANGLQTHAHCRPPPRTPPARPTRRWRPPGYPGAKLTYLIVVICI